MIIHEENIHRVFLCEMLSFIKKHENEITDITFGNDLSSMVIINMNDGDIHGFQLQSEFYLTHQSLWGGSTDVVPIRAMTWTDMLFTRMVYPDIVIVYHPFTTTSAKIHQLPYWIKRTEEAQALYLIGGETFGQTFIAKFETSGLLFNGVFDLVSTSNDFDISSRILDIMSNNEVGKYTKVASRVDVTPREMYHVTYKHPAACIKYIHDDRVVNPIINAMHYVDDGVIPDHTNGVHLKNVVDRLIDKTKNMELRMFLIRWKMEHYGFDERKELRL